MKNKMTQVNPPKAKKIPHKITQHGEDRVDDYHWMRDDNWQQVLEDPSVLSADIREHLEAENKHFDAHHTDFEKMNDLVAEEILARIKQDDESVHLPDGEWSYFSKYEEGQDYPVFYREHAKGGGAEVLYDGPQEKKKSGSNFFSIGEVSHSPDHKLLAYSLDDKGSEYYTIRIRQAGFDEDRDEVIENCNEDFVWSADSKCIFYVEREAARSKRVKCHVVGTDPKEDKIVFENDDDTMFLGVGKSASSKYIFIELRKSNMTEIWYMPGNAGPEDEPKCIAPRRTDHKYSVIHHGDYFYIKTDKDGAENYQIMRVLTENPSEENWQEYVPHRADTEIAAMAAMKDYMVRLEKTRALPQIIIDDYKGNVRALPFDAEAYSVGLSMGYEYESQFFYVSYQTPAQPSLTYEVNAKTLEKRIIKKQIIPYGHNPEDYVVKRLFIEARDGTEVPVTLLHHACVEPDGSAPLFLYGYGSYGISIPASYSNNIMPMVDRGVVYAIAHIRGGADMGQNWYKAGKLDRKKTTFNDFIDAAEALTDMGYGRKGEVVICGRSAGGMLVGACVNERRDLFGGVVAGVPFVDVLNTISDPSLPLTPPEWVEWGNPIESRAYYDYMSGYCPYTNVKEGEKYPPILALAGLTDYRVTYWEPAKWIAKLRDKATGGPFILKTEMDSGHGGSAGRLERIKEASIDYAFALHRFDKMGYDLRIKPKTAAPEHTPKAERKSL